MQTRPILAFALIAGLSAAVAGCDTIRDASGQGKASPDEFAVVTKAPLVIPPDFNLKPPAPGTAPANQIEPTQAAQSALFNTDPATFAASLPATMSPGERYLLASAGAQNADPAIRQQIASDASGMRGSDDSFTSSVLFWQGPTPEPGSTPLDADAEARRIDAARTGGTAATPPASGTPPPSSDSNSGSSWWPF
jgi:hypothetical protein